MSKFVKYLEEFVSGMTTNGAVNGGPLSAAIIAPNERSIKNKKAQPPKLIKYNDDGTSYSDDEKYQDVEQYGEEPESTEAESTSNADEKTRQLFQQFTQWLQQNSDLIDNVGEEDEEPEFDGVETPDEMGIEDNNFELEDQNEDPDRQGMIRVVQDAHLVYKREQPDGFYEELWAYNIGDNAKRDNITIKQDIIAGTDIPNNSTTSEDGYQHYTIWTCGNAQLLKISGLPN